MVLSETPAHAEPLFSPALLILGIACLPVTVLALRRMSRDAAQGPLAPPAEMPPVAWPAWFGGALFVALVLLMTLILWTYRSATRAGWLPWEPLGLPDMFSPGIFLAQALPSLVGLAAIAGFGKGWAASVGLRVGRPGRTALYGLAAAAAVLPICLAALEANKMLVDFLHIPPAQHPLLQVVTTERGAWVLPLALLQAGVLAAVSEEFIYRGVLMMTLARELGAGTALVASSAVFAAVHFPMEPQAILPLFCLAMALGYVTLRTGSLLAPVVAHGVFNSVMLLSAAASR